MTSNLVLMLLPVGLLLIVSGLCFVGCVFNTHGTLEFSTYSSDTVLANPDCVAYWRLNEEGGTTAIDSKGANNGKYVSKDNPATPDLKPVYPSPSYFVNGPRSAAATGTLKLGQSDSGIVIGDVDGETQATCMQTDGAYVEIAPNNVTTPAVAFTAEAWISPGWDPSDADAVHTFLDFRSVDAAGAISGFAMWIDNSAQLNGAVGRGAAGELGFVGGTVPLGSKAHVVLTLQGQTARLFVNGLNTGQATLNPGENYFANTTGKQAIGAGAPWADYRTDPTALSLFFPAFPFNGSIQDVAIYSKALDDVTILNHHTNGTGHNT